MGRLDIAMKQLMNDYDVFADAFNFRRAEGRKLLPSSLREMDPSAYASDAWRASSTRSRRTLRGSSSSEATNRGLAPCSCWRTSSTQTG